MDKTSEFQLIKDAAGGCSISLNELKTKYQDIYYKIRSSYEKGVKNILFDPDFVLSYPEYLIYEAAKTYNPDKGAGFSTWLTIKIRGHFLDSLKRKKNQSVSFLDYANNCHELNKIKQHESFFEKIKQCLEPKLYNTIVYRYGYGYTPREAAKKMNCHYETFRHRHNRALKILRDSLSHDCMSFL